MRERGLLLRLFSTPRCRGNALAIVEIAFSSSSGASERALSGDGNCILRRTMAKNSEETIAAGISAIYVDKGRSFVRSLQKKANFWCVPFAATICAVKSQILLFLLKHSLHAINFLFKKKGNTYPTRFFKVEHKFTKYNFYRFRCFS